MSRYHKYKLILVCVCLCLVTLSADDVKDKWHQPEKVMDLVGVRQGMMIGEVGAGHGYFTFKLAERVGESGKIYANDISRSALRYLRDRCEREGISNIETVIGEVENSLLPEELDMVFIVNAFHDLAKPVELLNNLSLSLKPDARVVIIDRDPEKVDHSTDHFLSREVVLEKIAESVFELERLETFLPQHNVYIIKVKTESKGITALLVMARYFGLNYFLNKDVFEQYGWNLIHTGALDSIPACPSVADQVGVRPIIPDVSASDISDIKDYDAVVIMPSAGNYNPIPDPFEDLLQNPNTMKIIASAAKEGVAVSAVCAGVRLLAAADLIRERTVVGSPRFQEEYEKAGAVFLGMDHPPAIAGNIITGARDLYYSFANCLAVATVIEANQPRGHHKDKSRGPFILSKAINWTNDTVVWSRTFGGKEAEGGRDVCETADGGFLITGYTFSQETGDADILVIKTNQRGDLVWAKSFGGAGTEYGYGCKAVDDGYVIAGYTTSFGEGSKDVYLLKLDFYGGEVWSQAFGGASWDVGMAVDGNSKDGYIVCGYTHSFGAGEEDVYVIRTDADGKEIWSKTFGGERYEFGNSVHLTSDGGCLVGATTGTFGKGNSDFYLVRIDASGNKIWTKSYGNKGQHGYGFDWCHSMCLTSDGGSILVGQTDSQDIMDALVVKFDSKGNDVWTRSFGNKPFYDYGHSVCEMKDGSYVVCGVTKSIQGNNDISLTKLDPKGNVLEEETFGAAGSDWGSSLSLTKDDHCILTGHTDSSGAGRSDMLLIKVKIQ